MRVSLRENLVFVGNIISLLLAAISFLLPLSVFANEPFAPHGGLFGLSLRNIVFFIQDILIPVLFAIGFLFFVWGMFYYFIVGAADDEKRQKGKYVILYTVLGFVLVIVFWGVVNLLAVSTGLHRQWLDPALIPGAPAYRKGLPTPLPYDAYTDQYPNAPWPQQPPPERPFGAPPEEEPALPTYP
jgi:hypothetical protein